MRYFYVSADLQYPTYNTFASALLEIEGDMVVSKIMETLKFKSGLTEKRHIKIILIYETTQLDYLAYSQVQ